MSTGGENKSESDVRGKETQARPVLRGLCGKRQQHIHSIDNAFLLVQPLDCKRMSQQRSQSSLVVGTDVGKTLTADASNIAC